MRIFVQRNCINQSIVSEEELSACDTRIETSAAHFKGTFLFEGGPP